MTDQEVREDRSLSPAEKEVTVRVAKDQDKVSIRSEVRGVTSRLLAHPRFHLRDSRHDDGAIVMVEGTLPIGCLSIRSEPRNKTNPAGIVTNRVLYEQPADHTDTQTND